MLSPSEPDLDDIDISLIEGEISSLYDELREYMFDNELPTSPKEAYDENSQNESVSSKTNEDLASLKASASSPQQEESEPKRENKEVESNSVEVSSSGTCNDVLPTTENKEKFGFEPKSTDQDEAIERDNCRQKECISEHVESKEALTKIASTSDIESFNLKGEFDLCSKEKNSTSVYLERTKKIKINLIPRTNSPDSSSSPAFVKKHSLSPGQNNASSSSCVDGQDKRRRVSIIQSSRQTSDQTALTLCSKTKLKRLESRRNRRKSCRPSLSSVVVTAKPGCCTHLDEASLKKLGDGENRTVLPNNKEFTGQPTENPPAQQCKYEAEFDLSDYCPAVTQYIVSQGIDKKFVKGLSGASVWLVETFVTKSKPDGDQPLHVYIQGPTKKSVKLGVHLLKFLKKKAEEIEGLSNTGTKMKKVIIWRISEESALRKRRLKGNSRKKHAKSEIIEKDDLASLERKSEESKENDEIKVTTENKNEDKGETKYGDSNENEKKDNNTVERNNKHKRDYKDSITDKQELDEEAKQEARSRIEREYRLTERIVELTRKRHELVTYSSRKLLRMKDVRDKAYTKRGEIYERKRKLHDSEQRGKHEKSLQLLKNSSSPKKLELKYTIDTLPDFIKSYVLEEVFIKKDNIRKATGASVSIRGNIFSQTNNSQRFKDETQPYFLVQGLSFSVINAGVEMIKDIVKKAEDKEKVKVVIVAVGMDTVLPEFDLLRQVEGENGANLQFVANKSGATVTLKGRGSGFMEPASGLEDPEALHLKLEHKNLECLTKAKDLALSLVKTVQQKYVRFCNELRQAAVSNELGSHQDITFPVFESPTTSSSFAISPNQPNQSSSTDSVNSTIPSLISLPVVDLTTNIPLPSSNPVMQNPPLPLDDPPDLESPPLPDSETTSIQNPPIPGVDLIDLELPPVPYNVEIVQNPHRGPPDIDFLAVQGIYHRPQAQIGFPQPSQNFLTTKTPQPLQSSPLSMEVPQTVPLPIGFSQCFQRSPPSIPEPVQRSSIDLQPVKRSYVPITGDTSLVKKSLDLNGDPLFFQKSSSITSPNSQKSLLFEESPMSQYSRSSSTLLQNSTNLNLITVPVTEIPPKVFQDPVSDIIRPNLVVIPLEDKTSTSCEPATTGNWSDMSSRREEKSCTKTRQWENEVNSPFNSVESCLSAPWTTRKDLDTTDVKIIHSAWSDDESSDSSMDICSIASNTISPNPSPSPPQSPEVYESNASPLSQHDENPFYPPTVSSSLPRSEANKHLTVNQITPVYLPKIFPVFETSTIVSTATPVKATSVPLTVATNVILTKTKPTQSTVSSTVSTLDEFAKAAPVQAFVPSTVSTSHKLFNSKPPGQLALAAPVSVNVTAPIASAKAARVSVNVTSAVESVISQSVPLTVSPSDTTVYEKSVPISVSSTGSTPSTTDKAALVPAVVPSTLSPTKTSVGTTTPVIASSVTSSVTVTTDSVTSSTGSTPQTSHQVNTVPVSVSLTVPVIVSSSVSSAVLPIEDVLSTTYADPSSVTASVLPSVLRSEYVCSDSLGCLGNSLVYKNMSVIASSTCPETSRQPETNCTYNKKLYYDAQTKLFQAEYIINDLPMQVRFYVMKEGLHMKQRIEKLSGAIVSLKGKYISPEKCMMKPLEGRPVYFILEGPSQQCVIDAILVIEILIKEALKEDITKAVRKAKFSTNNEGQGEDDPILSEISKTYSSMSSLDNVLKVLKKMLQFQLSTVSTNSAKIKISIISQLTESICANVTKEQQKDGIFTAIKLLETALKTLSNDYSMYFFPILNLLKQAVDLPDGSICDGFFERKCAVDDLCEPAKKKLKLEDETPVQTKSSVNLKQSNIQLNEQNELKANQENKIKVQSIHLMNQQPQNKTYEIQSKLQNIFQAHPLLKHEKIVENKTLPTQSMIANSEKKINGKAQSNLQTNCQPSTTPLSIDSQVKNYGFKSEAFGSKPLTSSTKQQIETKVGNNQRNLIKHRVISKILPKLKRSITSFLFSNNHKSKITLPAKMLYKYNYTFSPDICKKERTILLEMFPKIDEYDNPGLGQAKKQLLAEKLLEYISLLENLLFEQKPSHIFEKKIIEDRNLSSNSAEQHSSNRSAVLTNTDIPINSQTEEAGVDNSLLPKEWHSSSNNSYNSDFTPNKPQPDAIGQKKENKIETKDVLDEQSLVVPSKTDMLSPKSDAILKVDLGVQKVSESISLSSTTCEETKSNPELNTSLTKPKHTVNKNKTKYLTIISILQRLIKSIRSFSVSTSDACKIDLIKLKDELLQYIESYKSEMSEKEHTAVLTIVATVGNYVTPGLPKTEKQVCSRKLLENIILLKNILTEPSQSALLSEKERISTQQKCTSGVQQSFEKGNKQSISANDGVSSGPTSSPNLGICPNQNQKTSEQFSTKEAKKKDITNQSLTTSNLCQISVFREPGKETSFQSSVEPIENQDIECIAKKDDKSAGDNLVQKVMLKKLTKQPDRKNILDPNNSETIKNHLKPSQEKYEEQNATTRVSFGGRDDGKLITKLTRRKTKQSSNVQTTEMEKLESKILVSKNNTYLKSDEKLLFKTPTRAFNLPGSDSKIKLNCSMYGSKGTFIDLTIADNKNVNEVSHRKNSSYFSTLMEINKNSVLAEKSSNSEDFENRNVSNENLNRINSLDLTCHEDKQPKDILLGTKGSMEEISKQDSLPEQNEKGNICMTRSQVPSNPEGQVNHPEHEKIFEEKSNKIISPHLSQHKSKQQATNLEEIKVSIPLKSGNIEFKTGSSEKLTKVSSLPQSSKKEIQQHHKLVSKTCISKSIENPVDESSIKKLCGRYSLNQKKIWGKAIEQPKSTSLFGAEKIKQEPLQETPLVLDDQTVSKVSFSRKNTTLDINKDICIENISTKREREPLLSNLQHSSVSIEQNKISVGKHNSRQLSESHELGSKQAATTTSEAFLKGGKQPNSIKCERRDTLISAVSSNCKRPSLEKPVAKLVRLNFEIQKSTKLNLSDLSSNSDIPDHNIGECHKNSHGGSKQSQTKKVTQSHTTVKSNTSLEIENLGSECVPKELINIKNVAVKDQRNSHTVKKESENTKDLPKPRSSYNKELPISKPPITRSGLNKSIKNYIEQLSEAVEIPTEHLGLNDKMDLNQKTETGDTSQSKIKKVEQRSSMNKRSTIVSSANCSYESKNINEEINSLQTPTQEDKINTSFAENIEPSKTSVHSKDQIFPCRLRRSSVDELICKKTQTNKMTVKNKQNCTALYSEYEKPSKKTMSRKNHKINTSQEHVSPFEKNTTSLQVKDEINKTSTKTSKQQLKQEVVNKSTSKVEQSDTKTTLPSKLDQVGKNCISNKQLDDKLEPRSHDCEEGRRHQKTNNKSSLRKTAQSVDNHCTAPLKRRNSSSYEDKSDQKINLKNKLSSRKRPRKSIENDKKQTQDNIEEKSVSFENSDSKFCQANKNLSTIIEDENKHNGIHRQEKLKLTDSECSSSVPLCSHLKFDSEPVLKSSRQNDQIQSAEKNPPEPHLTHVTKLLMKGMETLTSLSKPKDVLSSQELPSEELSQLISQMQQVTQLLQKTQSQGLGKATADSLLSVASTSGTQATSDDSPSDCAEFETTVIMVGNKEKNIVSIGADKSVYASLAYLLKGTINTQAALSSVAEEFHKKAFSFIRNNKDIFISEINKIYDEVLPGHKLNPKTSFECCCTYLADPNNFRFREPIRAIATIYSTPVIVTYEDGRDSEWIEPVFAPENPPKEIICRGNFHYVPVIHSDFLLIGTWNLIDQKVHFSSDKLKIIDEFLEKHKIDFVCLQCSISCSTTCQISTENYSWWCTGVSKSNSGVAFLVRKKSSVTLSGFTPHFCNLVSADVAFKNNCFRMIGCDFSDSTNNKQLASVLPEVISQAPPSSQVVLLGEFNAYIGLSSLKEDVKFLIGTDLLQKYTNQNGHFLKELAVYYNLKIVTTFPNENTSSDTKRKWCVKERVVGEPKGSHILVDHRPGQSFEKFLWREDKVCTHAIIATKVSSPLPIPAESEASGHFKVATWHFGGCSHMNDRTKIDKILLERGVDFVCIQETKMGEQGRLSTDNYDWWCSGKTPSPYNIAFLLRKGSGGTLTEFKAHSKSVASAIVTVGKIRYAVVGCYLLHCSFTQYRRTTVDLMLALSKAPTSAKLLLLGDFSAFLGPSGQSFCAPTHQSEKTPSCNPGNTNTTYMNRLVQQYDFFVCSNYDKSPKIEPEAQSCHILLHKGHKISKKGEAKNYNVLDTKPLITYEIPKEYFYIE